MADYDIGEAFREIENELIGSMTRNLSGHRAQEIEQGYEWAQWQVMQLEALEEYRRRNAEKMPEQFGKINDRIKQEIRSSYNDAQTAQEREILKRVHNNTPAPIAAQTGAQTIQGEFFKVNDRKLDALINATTNDMQRAEYAVLRMTNDQYRSIIFNAQVYANTGAGTYAKAVDMATRDFLSAGINCIEYQNGRRVNISAYAEMALRTASKRAYLQGEGEMRQKWGIHTVIMNKRTNACPKCAPFAGRVIVDDVWSGGTREEADKNGYLLMSECIAQGLYHPNCQDSHSTYYGDFLSDDEGGETAGAAKGEMSEDYAQESPARKRKRKQQQQEYTNEELLQAYTPEEQERNVELYNAEQQENYCGRQVRRFERLSEFSIDTDNQREYGARKQEWQEKKKEVELRINEIKREIKKSQKKAKRTYINPLALDLITPERLTNFSRNISPDNEEKNEKNSPREVANAGESGIIEAEEFNPLPSNKVVPVLRKDSEKWLELLTDEEIRAIKKYTKNSGDPKDDKFYARLNAMLRGEIPKNDTLNYYAGVISGAISKFELQHDIICYRNMNFNPFLGVTVGDIIQPMQFFSTSVSRKGALRSSFQIIIRAKSGIKGAYIEQLSKFPNQREFLLDNSCFYRVISIDETSMELEVIS